VRGKPDVVDVKTCWEKSESLLIKSIKMCINVVIMKQLPITSVTICFVIPQTIPVIHTTKQKQT